MFNHDRVTLFLVDEDENLDGQLCYMCFFFMMTMWDTILTTIDDGWTTNGYGINVRGFVVACTAAAREWLVGRCWAGLLWFLLIMKNTPTSFTARLK